MTLSYFKDQIHEELMGARSYIDKAIEAKISHPVWSATFVKMADMEADHAGNLMKMMEHAIRDMKKSVDVQSESTSNVAVNPEDVYRNCMKEFGETMTYVTNMKRGL